MDESGGNSEVARAIHQIDLELEVAKRLEHGFAITARHDLINARMQRNGEHILQLIEQDKHEEAQALMNSDNWSSDYQYKVKQQHRTKKQKNHKKKRVSEHDSR